MPRHLCALVYTERSRRVNSSLKAPPQKEAMIRFVGSKVVLSQYLHSMGRVPRGDGQPGPMLDTMALLYGRCAPFFSGRAPSRAIDATGLVLRLHQRPFPTVQMLRKSIYRATSPEPSSSVASSSGDGVSSWSIKTTRERPPLSCGPTTPSPSS